MKIFWKVNIAAIIASLADFLFTFLLKYIGHLDAVLASILGTIFGGVINFLIGRVWVFKTSQTNFSEQGKKYFLIWLGNLLLNASGVYLLIKIMGVQYLIAKMITAITVAIGYNYPLQKGYVFKTVEKK
ncbi:MAG: GtrA family protein [Chitinophagia bacterium]|jgi:putative flippase GtrA|nr:GtrA family protein [Chitinophagia bacterium]